MNPGRQHQLERARYTGTTLSTEQADEIRLLYATSTLTQRMIARLFGVSQSHVSNIVCHRRLSTESPRWTYVPCWPPGRCGACGEQYWFQTDGSGSIQQRCGCHPF